MTSPFSISTPLPANDVANPMLLLPSVKPIYEQNTPEIADNQKPMEIENDENGVLAEEEDLKRVEDEKDGVVVEEEDQKPVEGENDGVVAESDQKKALEEPETQTLDLNRVMTVVRFRPINRHFRRPCHHHWMKRWMMMRPQIHGRQMPYGNDMILGGDNRKAFDPEFFHGGERKEFHREMFQGDDGERKEFDREMFHGGNGERKEFDREMFHGGDGVRPRWMRHHHHHYHHHGEHEGRPWYPFFGRHHHHDHDHDHHDHDDHHDHHDRFMRRPFIRRDEGEEEREGGGGFLDGIRNFVQNLF